MKSYGVSIRTKPLQPDFHMVLCVEYVALTFESVSEILWCDHSKEISSTVLSHGTICLFFFLRFSTSYFAILLNFDFSHLR